MALFMTIRLVLGFIIWNDVGILVGIRDLREVLVWASVRIFGQRIVLDGET